MLKELSKALSRFRAVRSMSQLHDAVFTMSNHVYDLKMKVYALEMMVKQLEKQSRSK